jgi:hypothetical protein
VSQFISSACTKFLLVVISIVSNYNRPVVPLYWLDDQGSILGKGRNVFLQNQFQPIAVVHSVSYPAGTWINAAEG